MINPSAKGWIKRFFTELNLSVKPVQDREQFYDGLRKMGIVYGHAIALPAEEIQLVAKISHDELSKICLLYSHFQMYRLLQLSDDATDFGTQLIAFYNQLYGNRSTILKKVLPEADVFEELEEILEERIQTNENIFSKNFSNVITNALLFQDVLAFGQFIKRNEIPENYLRKVEEAAVQIVLRALQTRVTPTPYDELIIKVFESSVRYSKIKTDSNEIIDALPLSYFDAPLEKYYLLDLAALALFHEDQVQPIESKFMEDLAKNLGFEASYGLYFLESAHAFLNQHKVDIPYLNYKNPVKHFYDHTATNVSQLIVRNKSRLQKELSNNKDLLKLLTDSTHRNLDEKEKKKVKKQLLEICKTIPSLTIFLLPGGSLLLPLLVKFIPQLLPSTFNENLE